MPKNYSTILVGDFNIDMLKKTTQSTTFQNLMYKHKLKLFFFESMTINNTQMNHIWTNAPTQQCHSGVTQAYWIDHKTCIFQIEIIVLCSPIYFTTNILHIKYIYHLCLSNKTHQLPFKLKLNCE
jgi:hypothetical protein